MPDLQGWVWISTLTRTLALCEYQGVNVISIRTIRQFARVHPDAADELDRWYRTASRARWKSLLDVRGNFGDADQFRALLIFNVRHNTYRLIVKVDYRANLLMVKEFISHKE